MFNLLKHDKYFTDIIREPDDVHGVDEVFELTLVLVVLRSDAVRTLLKKAATKPITSVQLQASHIR